LHRSCRSASVQARGGGSSIDTQGVSRTAAPSVRVLAPALNGESVAGRWTKRLGPGDTRGTRTHVSNVSQ
jgi:hypothetical protein